MYKISNTNTRPFKIRRNSSQNFNSNKSSVLVKAGGYAVFTGDSTGNLIYRHLKFKNPEEVPIVFQVPNHGHRNNSKLDWQANRNHPMRHVLHPIRRHPAYKQALFFCSVKAKVYIISHGKNERHERPHKEVITGILIAATALKTQCTIVVTHSFSLNKIDYPSQELFPSHQNWKDYVTILEPKDHEPYLTITLMIDDEPAEFCNTQEVKNVKDVQT